MAAALRPTDPLVIRRLLEEPYRFEFFQAVRILERLLADRRWAGPEGIRAPVGGDVDPAQEAVRFRALPSMGFPPSPVAAIARTEVAPDGVSSSPPFEMTVAFLGLTGPNGVLPQHYTRLLIERIREKDLGLRDFFDLFNHRLVSLFFRAWRKYRLPAGIEHARSAGGTAGDPFTEGLLGLVGFGTGGLLEAFGGGEDMLLYCSGLFAGHHRPAASLERMLAERFGLPVEVLQFQGRWLSLDWRDATAIGSPGSPRCRNSTLGVDAVLGERVWDVQSKFQVRLGPLDYGQYCRFIPAADGLQALSRIVRTWAGVELDFDVRLILKAPEVPALHLVGEAPAQGEAGPGPRLGWNTWLLSPDVRRSSSAEEGEAAQSFGAHQAPRRGRPRVVADVGEGLPPPPTSLCEKNRDDGVFSMD